MMSAGREATVQQIRYVRDHEIATLARLKKKGVKVYQFKDLAVMRAKMQPIIAKWVKRDPIIAEYVKLATRVESGK
jgi:TRAP-type C4-dicarboxylate transport system substrate-binding protein